MNAPADNSVAAPGFIRTSDGVDLFYRDWGIGEPILFVGGWALGSASWAYQMMALKKAGARCIAFDRRGHGRSTDPGRGYDFDTLSDDLATVIETLDLRNLTLVGHSMGCLEIVRYLTRRGSARVARVAMLGTMSPMIAHANDNLSGVPDAMFEQFRSQQLCRDLPRWIDDNMASFLSPTASPGMANWLRGIALECSLQALHDCNVAITSTDFRQELTRIDRPTLIIAGDLDVSAPLELTALASAALIPNARLLVYAGAAHGMFVTHMDSVSTDLLAFIGDNH